MEAVHNTRHLRRLLPSFLDPDCSTRRECPTVGEQKHDGVSVAELKNPLILRAPEGASFLSSWTRVMLGRQCLHFGPVGHVLRRQGGRRDARLPVLDADFSEP